MLILWWSSCSFRNYSTFTGLVVKFDELPDRLAILVSIDHFSSAYGPFLHESLPLRQLHPREVIYCLSLLLAFITLVLQQQR